MASTSHLFPPELVAAADPELDPVIMTDEDSLRNTLTDMPYVFTGANDDRIEGFLYRFKMGEDLKIVCVCHGLFLSPAEFVKHGGGGDVAYPLKHILVNPSPLY